MSIYIFDILLYYYICLCTIFLWPLRFRSLLVVSLHKEDYWRISKCVSFWLHGCCGKWEVWALVNRFNHTSGVTAVTPTDRPKSVNNCRVIKLFGGVFCVVTLLFWFFCGCSGFCHRTESDLFLFLPTLEHMQMKRRRPDSVLWQNPYTTRKIQKATCQHEKKNATQNFDYTTIADRFRTVSWINSSHSTGVI